MHTGGRSQAGVVYMTSREHVGYWETRNLTQDTTVQRHKVQTHQILKTIKDTRLLSGYKQGQNSQIRAKPRFRDTREQSANQRSLELGYIYRGLIAGECNQLSEQVSVIRRVSYGKVLSRYSSSVRSFSLSPSNLILSSDKL